MSYGTSKRKKMAGSSSGVRTHIMATNNMYLVRVLKETSNYSNTITHKNRIISDGTNLKN